MVAEEWKDVPGTGGVYQVSSAGNIRSWTKIKQGSNMTPNPVRGGHLMVRIGYPDGTKRQRSVHSLVAEAFLGPMPEGCDLIRHLDDNPANNALANIAYGTRSENARDSVSNGTHNHGSKTHCDSGHEFNKENTYYRPGGVGRACRKCRLAAVVRYQEKNR